MAEDHGPRDLRRRLADRRDPQVATRLPRRLHRRHQGRPRRAARWLKPWFNFWINLQEPRATFFAYLVAVVETLIALALIAGFARKLTYSAAIVFSLLIWSTAEGFGGPYTSGASDIGTAAIYALVFAALLVFSYYQGTPRLSVDYYIEQRIGWWHRIAEVGPGHHMFGTSKRPRPAPTPRPAV